MHAQRKKVWWSKAAFPALLFHAGQMIFQIISKKLGKKLKSCEAFSLALDEGTEISDTAQLFIFIGAVTAGFNTVEEFLDMASLSSTTTGQDICEQALGCGKVCSESC